MNAPALICQAERRRHVVREKEFNGLDYLEVSDDQRRLTVYFLGKAPERLVKENVRIEGGRRIRDIQVVDLTITRQVDSDLDDCMLVTVDQPGDFSIYTLCLVELDQDGGQTGRPLPGFDPRYACLDFSFKAGCPSDLDCKPQEICPPPERIEPEIDYLAKDYASFRQLILDRLALIMPDWQERHVPDIGIALVEILAYAGDHLSYYQDAVATEAYLDTARQRTSVRRHARLVDYLMHEGCNARAWVCLETDTDILLQPDTIAFITGYNDTLSVLSKSLTWDDLRDVPSSQYEVFEPLVEQSERPLKFYTAHNKMLFYTWGDRECCVPRGATTATLKDGSAKKIPAPDIDQTAAQQTALEKQQTATAETAEYERALSLQPGDILIFEEVNGPKTDNPADADPTHRHAVRLTKVEAVVDELYQQPLLEVTWAEEDALPFPLCISAIGPAPQCELLEDISIARGNVLLVDHGWTLEKPEDLGEVPEKPMAAQCEGECQPAEIVAEPDGFRPSLQQARLTFSQPLPAKGPSVNLLTQDPHRALPRITLTGTSIASQGALIEEQWTPRSDLLASYSQDSHFVVEMDNERYAHLRFGDGELGRLPEAGTKFRATYRVGNGLAGNVGAEAISHIVFRHTTLSGVMLRPRNPLPAQGGTPLEPLTEVKLFAPHTFSKKLQRAIIADDYAQLVMRDFRDKVQRAAARLRWTGSWYEVLVAIDPRGQVKADDTLLDEITGYLHRYRRIGHDLVVAPARSVPLHIEMIVCVLPNYLRGHIKAALLVLLSNRLLPDGQQGFFHPDNLTFGEGIYLSKLVAAAQAVAGVESVTVTKLERLFEGPNQELANGILPLGPLEIARLDNDRSFPENGKLVLDIRGGR